MFARPALCRKSLKNVGFNGSQIIYLLGPALAISCTFYWNHLLSNVCIFSFLFSLSTRGVEKTA
jgi:hypothetical protein